MSCSTAATAITPMWKNIPSYIKNANAEKIRDAVDKELAKTAEPRPGERVTPKEVPPIEPIPTH